MALEGFKEKDLFFRNGKKELFIFRSIFTSLLCNSLGACFS